MDATATDDSIKPPLVSVNRMAIIHAKQRAEHIDFYKHSLFANTYQQLKDIDCARLRPVRPHGTEPFLAFHVEFKQEQVVGEGGPYRNLFTDLAKELQDSSATYSSPLFIPCPNAIAKIGDNRDKYIIRCSATSSQQIAYYEFIGKLFGICIRTGVRFPLDLPTFVWKSLCNVDTLSKADLAAIDKSCVDVLNFISTCDEDTLTNVIAETFETTLSDGTLVQLCERGHERPVTIANRDIYCQLVIAARLCEHSIQIDAIRRGLSKLIPIQLLSLLTHNDLQLLIAGNDMIDIELLRRHTQYSGIKPDAKFIQLFWKVLNQFDQLHRRLFIRFAWAQDRLPVDDSEFLRSHIRLLIKPSQYMQPDKALPRSDTCFFNLELPAYSSEEIMRTKLLYAITTCSSMNADERVEDFHGRTRNANRRYDDDDY